MYLCLCVREWEGLCIKDLYVGAWVEDFCVVHIFCMIQNFCVVYKWVLVLLSNFWSGHKVSIREWIFTVNWLNVPGLILVCIQSIWNDFCEKKIFFFILLFTFFSFFVCFQIYPLFSAPFLWKYYVWIVEGIQIFWVGSKICLGAFKNLFIFGNIPLNYRFGVIFVTVYANVTKLWFIKVFATSKYYLEFIQWQQQHISSNIFNTLNLWQTFKRKLKV